MYEDGGEICTAFFVQVNIRTSDAVKRCLDCSLEISFRAGLWVSKGVLYALSICRKYHYVPMNQEIGHSAHKISWMNADQDG